MNLRFNCCSYKGDENFSLYYTPSQEIVCNSPVTRGSILIGFLEHEIGTFSERNSGIGNKKEARFGV